MKDHPYFYSGNFGLERETLRVDANRRLARTPHPFENEYMTRDFCENQTEIITPVCGSIAEMLDVLAELDGKAREILRENGESFWLYSNPPHFDSEDEIPIANFTGQESSKRRYRDQLQRRYGKRLMLFSGIHFNFSFSDQLLHDLHTAGDFDEFRDMLYLRLYKQLCRHSWLLVLLTAASPIYDRSLYEDGAWGAALSEFSSMRSGRRGYWNEFVPILRHDSLKAFIDSIRYYVNKGALFSASELYLPVRLKPRGVNNLDNLENGVSHIELRMFDLNPFEPLGISRCDLEFAHLLILYLISLPDFEYTPELQEQAVSDHRNAALYDLEGVSIGGVPILDRAREIIDDMIGYFDDNRAAQDVLMTERGKLDDRLCRKITEDIFR